MLTTMGGSEVPDCVVGLLVVEGLLEKFDVLCMLCCVGEVEPRMEGNLVNTVFSVLRFQQCTMKPFIAATPSKRLL